MSHRVSKLWILPCLSLLLAVSATAETQVAELTVDTTSFFADFGKAVAIDGNVTLVAAPDDAVPDNYTGSVYVFRDTGAGWLEEAKLTASDGQLHDRFGWALDLEGNVAVIGAPAPLGSTEGAAYVFRHDGTSWVEEARLIAPGTAWFGFSVRSPRRPDRRGRHVDESPGGGSDHRGDAWVFRHDGSTWVIEQQLFASDGVYSDHFGSAVAIDQDKILVGARGEGDESAELYGIGAVYAFEWDGVSWNEVQKFRASDQADQAFFGWAIAMHQGYAVVGSPGKKAEGVWSAGAGYIVRDTGASWVEDKKVRSHMPGVDYDFGHSVAIENDLILIADYGRDASGSPGGAIHPFRHDGVSWEAEPAFQAAGLGPYDVFGYDVDLSGGIAAVGAYIERDTPPPSSGAGFLFDVQAVPLPDCGGIDGENVLFVNGDQGGGNGWDVRINGSESITFTIEKPSGGGNGKFLVHMNAGAPDATTVTPLPAQLGNACFPMLLPPFGDAAPVAIWNNVGKENKVGSSVFFGTSIPEPARRRSISTSPPPGIRRTFPPARSGPCRG